MTTFQCVSNEPCIGDESVCNVHSVNARLTTMENKIDRVLTIAENVEKMVTTAVEQVKPVIDDLMKSPLLKVLGVKK